MRLPILMDDNVPGTFRESRAARKVEVKRSTSTHIGPVSPDATVETSIWNSTVSDDSNRCEGRPESIKKKKKSAGRY